MKFTSLTLALSLCLLSACRPGATDPKTNEFVLKESEIPSGLPLPTLVYEFDGNKSSKTAKIIEEHTSATGQRFLIYGFTTSITTSSRADLALYFKGRSGGKDQWIVQWVVDGVSGEKDFIYVTGTELDLVDTNQLKIKVK